VLDEEAFRELVAGKVVKLMTTTNTPLELILSDIGWSRMLQAIDDAMRGQMHAALDRDTVGSLQRWENLGHCPDCGCNDFEPGPRGGLAVNRRCVGCGAWWNTVTELGLIQRIREDEPKQPGRPVTIEQWDALTWLGELRGTDKDQWVFAPQGLSFTEVELWANEAGFSTVIRISSGDTLVRIR
jgi:hypothetical protein